MVMSVSEHLKWLDYNFERSKRCKDIVERLGVLSPSRVYIENHPADHPVVLFNATGVLIDDIVEIYARMVLGYYLYVSAIMKIEIPLDDILSRKVSSKSYSGKIVLYPSTKYDIWGVEDPRITRIDDFLVITYSGRTLNYFNSRATYGRVLPVIALTEINDRENWKKVSTFVLSEELRNKVLADKDAFLIRSSENSLILFHRPHLMFPPDCTEANKSEYLESYHLTISKVNDTILSSSDLKETEVSETVEILRPEYFERSLGWGTPPIEVEPNRYVTLVHAVDRSTLVYRVFALAFEIKGGLPEVIAVTPEYIFEPKETYEVYGDRPMVVFPCGLISVDDSLIVIYGAGDCVVGFGLIDPSDLLSLLNL